MDDRNDSKQPPVWKALPSLVSCFAFFGILAGSLPLILFVAWRISPPNLKAVENLNFDFTSSQPDAEVWLLTPKNNAKADLQSVTLHSVRSGRRFFSRGTTFDVTVIFYLPESKHNLALPMFQVTAEALNSDGEVLHRSRVPCLLKWESTIFRRVRLIAFGLPYLLGMFDDQKVVTLLAMRSKDGKSPLAAVRVYLNSMPGSDPPKGLPQLYAAKVVVEKSRSFWFPWAGTLKRVLAILTITAFGLSVEAAALILILMRFWSQGNGSHALDDMKQSQEQVPVDLPTLDQDELRAELEGLKESMPSSTPGATYLSSESDLRHRLQRARDGEKAESLG